MIHRCITQLREQGDTSRLSRLLGVTRSGYYAARVRTEQRPRRCAAGAEIKRVFKDSARTYGSRRLAQALRGEGTPVGRYRVRTFTGCAR